jgi:hypothetical protein
MFLSFSLTSCTKFWLYIHSRCNVFCCIHTRSETFISILLEIWYDTFNMFESSIYTHNLDGNFLSTLFIENKMACQITKLTTNSKFSIALTKDWHSVTVIESRSSIEAFSRAIWADLIWGSWNMIAWTLFIWLYQCVLDHDLTVNPGTSSTKIFHLLVDFANNVYIRWMIPKKEIACLQDLTNTKNYTFPKLMYNKK